MLPIDRAEANTFTSCTGNTSTRRLYMASSTFTFQVSRPLKEYFGSYPFLPPGSMARGHAGRYGVKISNRLRGFNTIDLAKMRTRGRKGSKDSKTLRMSFMKVAQMNFN